MCILVCRQGIAGLMDNSNDQKHNDTSPKRAAVEKNIVIQPLSYAQQ